MKTKNKCKKEKLIQKFDRKLNIEYISTKFISLKMMWLIMCDREISLTDTFLRSAPRIIDVLELEKK